MHQRVWVKCSLPELGFADSLLALSADLAPFSLPNGIDGLVGLSFLTRFARWGGEQNAVGEWSFFLET